MTFEQQLKSLILFHLEEYKSARHLLQVLEQDDFARSYIAPAEGIGQSSYGEALNTRGLEQLLFVYEKLQAQATAHFTQGPWGTCWPLTAPSSTPSVP